MNSDPVYPQVEALRALGGLSSHENDGQIISALIAPEGELRRAGLAVLGERFDPEYEETFLDALDDEEEQVAKVAAENLLASESEESRLAAVTFLGKNPDNIPLLITALKDDWYTVREAAVHALTGLMDYDAIDPILHMLHEPEDGCRYRQDALSVLGSFDQPAALDEVAALLPDEWLGASAATILGGKASSYARDLLFRALDSDCPRTCLSAVTGISCNGDIRALGLLCLKLENGDALLRIKAADALCGVARKLSEANRLSDAGSEPVAISMSIAITSLTKACSDPEEYVRCNALDALGVIGASRTAPHILSALRDTSTSVFLSAAQAAAAMKLPEGFEVFLDVLGRRIQVEWNWASSAAMSALGALAGQKDIETLARFADQSDWKTRTFAAEALLGLGDARGWYPLVQALSDREEDWTDFRRADIAAALARSGDPRAADVLLGALEGLAVDPCTEQDYLESVIRNLGNVGDKRAIEPIRKWQDFDFDFYENVVGDAILKLESKRKQPLTI